MVVTANRNLVEKKVQINFNMELFLQNLPKNLY